ncbi:3-isopropylmalate dehydratase large subunit [Bordetella tumbae]
MFDKVWQRHAILERDGATLLHVGRHLVHDGSRNAFQQLHDHGLLLRRSERTFATPDHYVPSATRNLSDVVDEKREMVVALSRNAKAFGIPIFPLGNEYQGIVHVMGPELGITLPGLVIVCGDSHTATHGAFGALAFGIGTSEVAHVLATQTLWQIKPKSLRIHVAGELATDTTAKDLILHIISQIGANGAGGYIVEYAGSAVRALSMEGRMTLCNMSIEAGARAGMIAPDSVTFDYLRGRRYAPDQDFDAAVQDWQTLRTDVGASFDREVQFNASAVSPMLTWGTSPQDGVPAAGCVPDPSSFSDPMRQAAARNSLAYMGLEPGQALRTLAVNRVFIGSCTNGRIEDLRAAASLLKGRKVRVPTLVVPGSTKVKTQAEQEGLARILIEAGAEWRESACSMCSGTNGDIGNPGERIVSTTNRNFVGRQGKNVRTHLASPLTAAACAIVGRLIDPRELQ